ncbi:GNAT family N-acetyltransferase [Nocardioides sp. MAH-18]|uniref:GNAT family N-acetyltransferase n=1 Tax=Nocardioides agri TaxID=2682843 RepID=A0A6L6XTL7_9ACTN|nr:MULTISPECIES: GNAT family N-acetyltransferase [unclassified Nocardioides]MBA2955689.1 GNAT family N-acetyltransferase [Nocardioides sp. CGMCC 1.13656]MVQ50539.1 GNAT family N-acetyltransferase [Nocardioides sp. MAH-18]
MTDIRVGIATDADRYRNTDDTVWFQEPLPAATDVVLTGLPADQRFAAEIDGAATATYPGVYGVFPLELALPGPDGEPRLVPCAGLTWVGVHPDHRRQGVLTAMMRHHLEQVRDTSGTHVSALHASEPAIYGRYGYGLSSLELEVMLSRGATLTAPGLDADAGTVTTQMVTITDPGLPERMRACHRAHAESGEVVGSLGYYERICVTHPEELRDKEPWRVLFARRDGEDVGFAVFRREHKWERARPSGKLEAWKVVGAPATRLALLRRLVDFDLMGSVKLRSISSEDPVLAWAGGPRGTSSIETYDSLWIRIVDLPEALAARTWSAPCDVVVQVDDTAAPWNDGRWRIVADADGSATAERTDAEADLRLPVAALGAAYTGGGNLVGLVRAGQVTEARAGTARELWRALRTDVPPAAAVGF